MIFRPVFLPFTGPLPPRFFAARFFAATNRPPLLFFAMKITSSLFAALNMRHMPSVYFK